MLLRAAVAPPPTCSSRCPVFRSSRPLVLNPWIGCLPSSLRLSSSISVSKPSPSSSPPLSADAAFECPPQVPSFLLTFSSPITRIVPFLCAEWEAVFKGWVCSVVAVSCLFGAVPKLGRLPCVLADIRSPGVLREGTTLVALAFARSAADYQQQAFLWEATTRCVYKLRVHIFDLILQRDLGFFEGRDALLAGDVAYRMTSDAADVSDALYALLTMTVPNTLQLVAMAAQMVAVNPMLSLLAALAAPCVLFAMAYLGESLRKISRKASVCSSRFSAYLNEVLPSMLAVKAYVGESKESLRFHGLAHDNLLAQLKKRKLKALIPQLVQALYVGGLLVLCSCTIALSRNSCDSSSFFSFITALTLLIDPIKGVGKAYNELKQGEPAIERLFDLTRFSPKVIEKADAMDLDRVSGDIKFCGVTFRYGHDIPYVLDGINLHIRPGERVALVGPSGGGKTTLSKLLLRLYDPQSGSILVDNHDIRDVKLRSLRKHIVLVSQESMLFSGTVAENIGYRDLTGQINLENVKNAAQIANADEFIAKLANGYHSNIGQRGSLLSGGQKQRIAIARALYQEASILILDEATSALDSSSELLVRQALEHLMDNHTVLVIAHRLETVQMADRILVLDRGKLTEVSKSSFFRRKGECESLLLDELVV